MGEEYQVHEAFGHVSDDSVLRGERGGKYKGEQ